MKKNDIVVILSENLFGQLGIISNNLGIEVDSNGIKVIDVEIGSNIFSIPFKELEVIDSLEPDTKWKVFLKHPKIIWDTDNPDLIYRIAHFEISICIPNSTLQIENISLFNSTNIGKTHLITIEELNSKINKLQQCAKLFCDSLNNSKFSLANFTY